MKTALLLIILFLGIIIANAQTSGLVAFYPFNGNANDSSGNNNNGTVNGATLTTDKFGNLNSAYSFDGTNDYISCLQPGPLGTNPRTISFWAKTDTAAKTNQTNAVLSYGASSSSFNYGDRLEINLNSGTNGLTLTVGGAYLTKVFDNTDGGWHHYALVFEGGEAKKMHDFRFYADGQLLTTTSGQVDHGHTINTSGEYNLHIGQLYAYGRYFKGILDDIMIYDRALSDGEIKASFLGLIAYYPFNGNANDSSGFGHNGTVNGAVLSSDRFGNGNSAYEFDGINDYINIPHSPYLNIDKELTISVWVKPVAFPVSGSMMLLGKSNYSSNTNFLLRIKPSGFIQFEFKTFANTSDNPLVLNEWNHIAVTSDSLGEKKVYVNNIIASHTTAYSPFGLVTNPLTLGAAGYSSEYFKGSLDEVRIYNSALSAVEIDKQYNTLISKIQTRKNDEIKFYVTNNYLYFKNSANLDEIKSISTYDVTGRKVIYTTNITNSISFDSLKKGIYFILIENRNKSANGLKFVKY